VLVGPYTYNFTQAAASAIIAGAALRVERAEELMAHVRALLHDPALCERMGKAGIAFCATHRGATERTLAVCERLLGPAPDPTGPERR
jgi:3-deoxy-D-manno-octulosonic-acid transferase